MGVAVFATAAVILGFAYAVVNVGASRVFWALFGYHLGKKRRR